MLQNIRDRLTGPLVWFVVGLIAIPFAFWGIGTFNFGGGDPVLVKVGDQDISQSLFQRNFNNRYQQYRNLMGDSFRSDLFDEEQFRRLTLEDMIQDSAMRQFAVSNGYRASDQTLRELLLEIPAFQSSGKFSKDAYIQVLQREGSSPEQYEAQLRQSLAIDQIRSAVQGSAIVTAADAWQAYRLEQQTRTITAVQVKVEDLRNKVQISDEEISAHYEANKANYKSAERVKVQYIELDRNKMPPVEPPAQEILKALYDAEKGARFSNPEERRASHILIEFSQDKAKAEEMARTLTDKLRKGEAEFAELAKAHSSDAGSKDKGGDLGWVRKGVMVPQFEEALFAMEAKKVSDPVESEFGWHVILLDDVRAPSTRAFEDESVQAELREVFAKKERETQFQDLSAQLELLAFENTALEPVAQKLGLEIRESDWMTRGAGEDIGKDPAIRQAAFAPEVLESGENSKPIPFGPDALVVVHKAKHEVARQLALDEVRDQVEASLVAESAAKLASETAAEVLAEAKAGKPLREVAKARELTLQFEGDARRGQAELGASVAARVFKMPRPSVGSVVVEALDSLDGSVTVVELKAVNEPQRPDDIKEKLGKELRQIREGIAGSEFAAYQGAVENEIGVKMVKAPEAQSETPQF